MCSLLCHYNLHLWKGILYEWKENRIGKLLFGQLFLWAWRHFYDIYWFLHNSAVVLWPLNLCCTLKAREYRANSGLTNNWYFSSVSRRRNWKPLKKTDREQSIPAPSSFRRCSRDANNISRTNQECISRISDDIGSRTLSGINDVILFGDMFQKLFLRKG